MKLRSAKSLTVLSCIILPFSNLQANPAGAVVAAGNATFNTAGSTLTINQATPRLIVNWSDFSIAAGELTRFIQPGAGAAPAPPC